MTLTFKEDTHEYFWNGEKVPYSLTGILAAAGLVDTTYYTEEARLRGQYVHEATQLLDEGCLDWDSLDSVIIPHVQGYDKFLRETRFRPEHIEKRMYHPKMRYACTLDRIGELNGQDILLELKTSATLEDWWGAQLSGQNLTLPSPLPRFSLQLLKNGDYRLTEFKDPVDNAVFLAAHTLVYWKDKGLRNGSK